MKLLESVGAGLAGAVALNVLHESVRQVRDDAPRMDILGGRAIAKGMRAVGVEPPPTEDLYAPTLAADLVSNAAYYGLVGVGDREGVWPRGILLGLAAGIGGVVLPGPMGLGKAPSARTPQTALMTVAWYLAGGLAAATAYHLLSGPSREG